jgi:hypothetical protein
MSKQFYAAYRPYGITVENRNGMRGDALLRFSTKAGRDAWLAADLDYTRESVAASDPDVRACLRFEERTGYPVFRVGEEWERN